MPELKLINDARKFNPGWRLWFLLLQLVNLVAPLFFIGHPEALAVLAGYLLSAPLIVLMHGKLGWVRLLGAGHFIWFFILPWLAVGYVTEAPSGPFVFWLLAVLIVNGICLLIDVIDVGRYLAGEREPIV